ncbi:MAG TPA: T9SS type A sorting domain-containing protein [Chitinophagales bacterium]|nr:T9SS type A sorting domain-containing protein [Chitinophagales bacterium]
MKRIYAIVIVACLFGTASAQHEFDKWIFGNGLGIDFTSGTATTFTSTINAWDNAASISDANGNLLFYSEGTKLYDRNAAVMPHGAGLLSDTSGGQPVTIVRKPGSENLYYVFTCPNFGGPNGLRYTVVDMSLNGGLGDVDTNAKNILFYTPTAEKLVPVVHANGYDIWILAHEWGTNTFRAYLLTANGFVSNYVASTIGSVHGGNVNNAIGQLTVSKDGSRVACCLFADGKIEIFDFNRQSGVLTNAKTITGYNGVLGLEFSPDASKLYATRYLGPNITQFDLSNYTQSAIIASASTVGTIPTVWGNYYGGYMTLGPDDKIYVAQSFNNKVGVINNPNALDSACNYDGNALNFGSRKNDAGLVDKIAVTPVNYSVHVEIGNSQTICNSSYIIFDPQVTNGVPPLTYAWTATGDQLSCNSCKHPGVTVGQNSTYILVVTDANGKTGTDTVEFTTSGTASTLGLSLVKLNNIDCAHSVDSTRGEVTNGTEPINYHWGDGSDQIGTASELHMYSAAGIYVVSVTDATGCINSAFDTVINAGIIITAGQVERPICIGDSSGSVALTVTGGTTPYTYVWSNGATTAQLDSVPAGSYSVTVSDVTACSAIFDYNLNPANDVWGYYVYLSATEANCGNTGAVLADVQNGVAPYTYLWSNGDTTQNIAQLPGGEYSITVSDSSGCRRYGHIEVETFCASIIKGSIFVDTNQNCIFDTTEIPMQALVIKASGNGDNYYGSTNANGEYQIVVPDTGTYTISAVSSSSPVCTDLTMCNNPNQTITIATLGDSSLNNNFVSITTPGFDLRIHPGWTAANPGFEKEYWVMPYNQSGAAFNGQATVTIVYDSLLVYQNSLPTMPVHDAANHTLTWVLDSLPTWTWNWNQLRLRSFFLVPIGTSLGQELHSHFYITPTAGDCDSTNNEFHTNEIVTGSFDPNEKEVEPKNTIDPTDSVLRYTIHFQNCGTDSTHFVILRDTLSPYLDPLSVVTVASSHPYSDFSVSGAGILTWTFNPLRLVDSITNPEGSKGFVTFTIEKRANLPIGTVLSNSAAIYFDYNEPVITNTVRDTVWPRCNMTVALTPVNTSCGNNNGSASAIAAQGTGVYTYTWSNGAITPSISNLAAGSYTVTVSDQTGCSLSAAATVAGSGVGSVAVTADKTTICVGDISEICAPAGFSAYQWNTGGTTECINANAAGSYYVTVTDNGNCTVESNHISVNTHPVPSISISVSGDTMTCNSAGSYQWYYNNNLIQGATSNVYVGTQSGAYTVVLTDNNGCNSTSNAVNLSVGFGNELSNAFIQVYPNPSESGNWILYTDANRIGNAFEITDNQGRLIYRSTIQQATTPIHLDVASGLYLLKISAGNANRTFKLVKL